jgi:hypothetical protein
MQAHHPIALTTTPNSDLLLRQRTFSIDETREQMQQGRPVQREAVVSGAVDYGSLLYGEDSTQIAASTSASQTAPPTMKKDPKESVGGGGSWAGVLMKPGPVVETPTKSKPIKAAAEKQQNPPITPNGVSTNPPASSNSDKGETNKKKKGGGEEKKREVRETVYTSHFEMV